MSTVSLQELQRDPLGYINRAAAGESILVTRNNHPVVELRPVAAPCTTPRPFGLAAGEFAALHSAETNIKGEFKIKGIAPGSYMLHAQQRSSDDATYHASQKVDVASDNIDSITLAMGRGVHFAGRIELSGKGLVQLDRIFLNLISSDDQSPEAWTSVKKDGTFDFLDVPDGTYDVTVTVGDSAGGVHDYMGI